MTKFILVGKIKDIIAVLSVLAELEWTIVHLPALLDGQVIRVS